jgi:cilia- and flagella-associated protein 57
MMTLPVACRHCFGYRPDVHNSLQYVDEGTIAYPVGHNIVLYNTDTKTQKFIQCSADTGTITALALSPNRKYLAVAESSAARTQDGRGVIAVYDLQTLKRRKTLTTPESNSGEYVWMHFSPDSRNLLAQAGGPDCVLTLWVWEKARVSSTSKVGSAGGTVLSCLFCPNDTGLVSVLGATSIKMLRSNDGVLKAGPQPLAKRDPQEFVCQTWITDSDRERLLVGCQSGDILLVDGLDLKAVLQTDGGSSCDCILPWAKGFVTGQGNGTVSIFERVESADGFQCTKTFKFGATQHVVSMALSPQDSSLAVGTDTGRICTLPIGSIDILKPEDDNFELLGGATVIQPHRCATVIVQPVLL